MVCFRNLARVLLPTSGLPEIKIKKGGVIPSLGLNLD